jgi:hypothetical protein
MHIKNAPPFNIVQNSPKLQSIYYYHPTTQTINLFLYFLHFQEMRCLLNLTFFRRRTLNIPEVPKLLQLAPLKRFMNFTPPPPK